MGETGPFPAPPDCDNRIDEAGADAAVAVETVPDDASAEIDEHAGEDGDRSQSGEKESCAFAIEGEEIDNVVVAVTVMVAAVAVPGE